jgi:hypothetical protein
MKKILTTLALGTTLVFSLAGTAEAKSGDVQSVGTCSKASSSKIKLRPDNGRIETEFEVDQNRVGQRWNVAITDNGVVVARGTATTVAPSGSFEFRRLLPNRAGTDTIVARAANPVTGESCVARASL